ncbi:MAG TPA: ABC transporter permease [Bacteroidota bacterium]|jgi:ABC-type lipoprotein release transport system permease subunit|nr:ABC transporter permease [Bacteroidota bacterium]
MKIPFKYTVRNMVTRRLTTVLTVTGIALVVFVFTAVLMMADGVRKTLVATGSENNVMILRKSATGEITSIISREQVNIIKALPHIATSASDKPLVSGDGVVIINLTYQKGDGFGNVTVRGVTPEGVQLRSQVKLAEGRMFTWGSREIIVGRSIANRFRGVSIGEKVKFGGDFWTVVGTLDSDGSGFDSEIWGDVDQLSQAFGRFSAVSIVLLRLDDPNSFEEFKAALDKDIRLQYFEPKREKQFYDEQSEDLAFFISALGIFVTMIFSAGAMIGAMITMYAAVSNRTVDIGTLRALGFRRQSILWTFFLESIFLALIGGVVGIVLASFLQFINVSMINFTSFSELAFKFAVSPIIIIQSFTFAIVMGIIGGFLPAARAARLDIVSALRAS